MLRKLTIVLAVSLMGLAAIPEPSQAQEEPEYGGILRVSLQNDLQTLDPTHQSSYGERFAMYALFDSVFQLSRDSSIEPALAESWDFENDGTRLVLHLRSGVKFHDGTDFDAEAVKWNLERRMDETVNSPARQQLVEAISGIEVIDPLTVAINLNAPSPSLLGELAQRAGLMISPTAATEAGDDFGSNPVGTGPFVFERWERGGQIVLAKNPNHWEEGLPYLDGIEFILTATPVVGIPRLMTGEVDVVAPLSPIEVRQLASRPEITIEERPVSRWVSLQFRVDRAPFDDKRMRQAIAYSIDRQRIVDVVVGGEGTVSEGSVPPGLWWFDEELKSLSYDPEKARALLAEMGYTGEAEITLTAPPEALYSQITQLVQDQLKDVGINAVIQPASPDWYPQLVDGRINFVPIRWTVRPDPDGLFTLLFHSQSPNNTTKYANPVLDDILDKAKTLTDRDERTELYFEAGRIIADDLPYVPLFFQPEYAALSPAVGNDGTIWVGDQAPRLRHLWKSSE